LRGNLWRLSLNSDARCPGQIRTGSQFGRSPQNASRSSRCRAINTPVLPLRRAGSDLIRSLSQTPCASYARGTASRALQSSRADGQPKLMKRRCCRAKQRRPRPSLLAISNKHRTAGSVHHLLKKHWRRTCLGKLKWLWTIRVNGNAIRSASGPNRRPWRMRAISSFVALHSETSESWKAEILSTTAGRRTAHGRQEIRRQVTQGLDPDALW
jgi:hypothetical protein